jgi:hypothetical protein
VPLQLSTLDAWAVLPIESMLKSAAAPNAAAAENLYVLLIFVIFLSLGLRPCLIVGRDMAKFV